MPDPGAQSDIHPEVPMETVRRALALVGLGLALALAPAASAVERLPRSFMWGVSGSAWQSEGGFVDDNWHHYASTQPSFEPIGRAVDFRHRYPSDIALARGLGANTYRVGISWARVQPRRGKFSQGGLRYYDRVFRAMAGAGIRPLVTLSHWDYPRWAGSWAEPRMADDFLRYVRKVVSRYRRHVRHWLTFNEAHFFILAEFAFHPLEPAQMQTMADNLVAAHRRAYDLIHRLQPRGMVSTNLAWIGHDSAEDPQFFSRVAAKLDYVGLDYYYPAYSPDDLTKVLSGRSWEAQLDPFGLYMSLRTMARRFPRLPIIVTENGMPTDNGKPRPDGYTRGENLADNLYWLQHAREDGVNVIGYLYWSLTDNYEIGSYRGRFGLYTVNARTDPKLRRRPTDAVPVYRAITRRGGVRARYRLVRRPAAADWQQAVPAWLRGTCLDAAGDG
jgi:beta-glucosidase